MSPAAAPRVVSDETYGAWNRRQQREYDAAQTEAWVERTRASWHAHRAEERTTTEDPIPDHPSRRWRHGGRALVQLLPRADRGRTAVPRRRGRWCAMTAALAFLDGLDDAFGTAPPPRTWAVARGARRNGPHEPAWGGEHAFRDGVAEPAREQSTLDSAAALDCARHARGYGRRAAPDCALCRGLGILTTAPGTTRRPVVVHCPDCDGQGWRR